MAAYIDAHRDRFGVGPICRVLADCPPMANTGRPAYRFSSLKWFQPIPGRQNFSIRSGTLTK